MKIILRILLFFGVLAVTVVGFLYYKQLTYESPSNIFQSLKTSLVEPLEVIKITPDDILPKTPCQKTLYYSFGKLDEKHNITTEKLLLIMQQAEVIWEKELNYNLFEYKPEAEFKINFIFDERQERTLLNKYLDSQLNTLKHSQADIFGKHTELSVKYNKLWEEYQEGLESLEKKLEDYNEEVKYWNKKGGAPKEEYDKLVKESEELSEDQEDLEDKQKKINKLVKKVNTLATKEQKLISQYNAEVTTYQDKFGAPKKFSQGEYFGVGINIYQFRENSDLVLVLAHELGHALSLAHVENPKSIMYYLMGEQNLNALKLTAEDISALQQVCRLKK